MLDARLVIGACLTAKFSNPFPEQQNLLLLLIENRHEYLIIPPPSITEQFTYHIHAIEHVCVCADIYLDAHTQTDTQPTRNNILYIILNFQLTIEKNRIVNGSTTLFRVMYAVPVCMACLVFEFELLERRMTVFVLCIRRKCIWPTFSINTTVLRRLHHGLGIPLQ